MAEKETLSADQSIAQEHAALDAEIQIEEALAAGLPVVKLSAPLAAALLAERAYLREALQLIANGSTPARFIAKLGLKGKR